MTLKIIGTGTAAPHADKVGASLWVEHKSVRLLLDCGPAAVHGLARHDVPWSKTTHLAITHFHTDHIADIPYLLFALKHGTLPARREKLVVIGPVGTRELFAKLAAAFGDYIEDPGFDLLFEELAGGETLPLGDDVELRTYKTRHTPESLAYRVEADAGRSAVGYTGDTGPDEALGAFLRGVDVLVAECSLPDDQAIDTHLTPARCADLARAAEPRTLVLTHVYPQLEGADLPALVRAARWGGEVVVGASGTTFRPHESAADFGSAAADGRVSMG